MPCRSAPINPRSGVVPESMAFEPGWRVRWAEEFCNDDERRAGTVSPSSRPDAPRSSLAPQDRLRPSVSARSPQQRPPAGRTQREQRPVAESIRLRNPKRSRRSRSQESSTKTLARDSQSVAHPGGLRHRDFGAAGSGGQQFSVLESRNDDAFESSSPARRLGLASRAVLSLIRAYQRLISPSLGPLCRYEPTCSHYAHEAIERHGLMKGAWLGLRRLSRCRPYGGNGYDPVPR